MFQNVFLTGGMAQVPYLKLRMERELLECRPFQSTFGITLAGKHTGKICPRVDFNPRFVSQKGEFSPWLMTLAGKQNYPQVFFSPGLGFFQSRFVFH